MNKPVTRDSRSGVRVWLVAVMGLILAMVAIGGITRLTESGLSMVTWEPILGTWPPRTEAQWQHRFDQYQAYPEFKELRPDMTLTDFKQIFWWEYLHRLLGRLLGLVYALPLAWFWIKGRLDRGLKIKLLIGLLLGGGQGVMGWYMVKSGLVDNPFVSHYRLAAHLGLAFIVFAYLGWIYLTIFPYELRESRASKGALCWAVLLSSLLVVQIVWGAFVAGLDAGFFYNTFPKMQGQWIPAVWNHLQPLWRNLFDNPATVQWIHRLLGTLLGALTIAAWFFLRRDPTVRGRKRLALFAFVLLIIVQFWLGVFTLVLMVPITLAVAHQVTACLLIGATVFLIHSFRGQHHA